MPIFLPSEELEHDLLLFDGNVTLLNKGPSTAPRPVFLWSYKGSWFWDFGDILWYDRPEPFGPYPSDFAAMEYAESLSAGRGIIASFEAPYHHYWRANKNYAWYNESNL